jgi:signal recognition particle receptor subunit beta
MPAVNLALRRYVAEIVYHGPAGSGKTTTLEQIASQLPGARLLKLETDRPCTELFDLLPVAVQLPAGWSLQCNLKSLPGAVRHRRARLAGLVDPDAVVFVADSGRDRAEANRLAMDELGRLLEASGRGLDDVPVVLQFNRQDRDDVLSWDELQALLNPGEWPAFASVAHERRGILLPFGAAVEAVRRRVVGGMEEAETPEIAALRILEERRK